MSIQASGVHCRCYIEMAMRWMGSWLVVGAVGCYCSCVCKPLMCSRAVMYGAKGRRGCWICGCT